MSKVTERNNALCLCGHRFGIHTASKYDQARPCLSIDDSTGASCTCAQFCAVRVERHGFVKHKRYPWCDVCGYSEHERLQHINTRSRAGEGGVSDG